MLKTNNKIIEFHILILILNLRLLYIQIEDETILARNEKFWDALLSFDDIDAVYTTCSQF